MALGGYSAFIAQFIKILITVKIILSITRHNFFFAIRKNVPTFHKHRPPSSITRLKQACIKQDGHNRR